MRRNIVKTRLIIAGTLTLITIFAWIAFDIYSGLVTDTVTPNLDPQFTALNPRLDVQVLDHVANKRSVQPDLTQPFNPRTEQSVALMASPTPTSRTRVADQQDLDEDDQQDDPEDEPIESHSDEEDDTENTNTDEPSDTEGDVNDL